MGEVAGRTGGHRRVAIIGTGFGGVGVALGLKRAGIQDFVVFERARDVGGTWRDNTYPGCQCDVSSHLYSFSFRANPEWTRTYSTQPEIWAYLRQCTTEAGVLPHIRFEHEVTSCWWDEQKSRWVIETNRGTWTADFFISAHGALAEPSAPAIEGLDSFEGDVFHSATWDQNSDLRGRRVAVIGTGASAIQIVPRIRRHVEKMYVFQRTPAWVLPHTDRPISARERRVYRRLPALQRLIRHAIYYSRELVVVGLAKNTKMIAPLRTIATAHLRRQVRDPELRRKLQPRYSPGCKRLLLSNHFYPALTAPNVDLVTDGIVSVRPRAIATADGTEREVDTIILATGFRVTDNPMATKARGRGGRSLADVWTERGMRAYLGTVVEGFPNFFLMTGPNTGIGHTSLLVMIEAQIDYIVQCLRFMDEQDVAVFHVRPEVVESFNRELQAKMKSTVWTMGGCSSWYLDDRGRNPTMWPDFTWRFRRATRSFEPADYDLLPAFPRSDRELVSA